MISTWLADLSFGIRLLLKHKSFTFVALLTLALCIGANSAVFSVLYAILLRPLPFPESDRLVQMHNLYPKVVPLEMGANSVPDYLDRRAKTEVFEEVALYNGGSFNIGLEGSPERVSGRLVTPSYFPMLRARAAHGRVFVEEDGEIGQQKKVILSHRLWEKLFAGDESVVGRDLRINSEPFSIVGIMPPDFRSASGEEPLLWVPLAFTPQQRSDDSRHSNSFHMLARLAPGVSVTQAQDAVNRLNEEILEKFPETREMLVGAGYHTPVVPWRDLMVKRVRAPLYLLQGGIFFVLLIGCVNIANLLLSQAIARLKEMAIRFSLGAGRLRLLRQLLTESCLLALAGGGLGLLVGVWALQLFQILGLGELPRGQEVAMNATTVLVTLALALGCGLVFGLFPVFTLWRSDLNTVLRNDSRTATAGAASRWVRSGLVVTQVALALVLLVGAGLLLSSFHRLQTVDPGFDADRVTTAALSLSRQRYPEGQDRAVFLRALLERLRQTPGLEAAGLTDFLPFSGQENASVISIEGQVLAPGQNPPVPHNARVDDQYFQAMGIPLREGRYLTRTDLTGSEPVLIIDRQMAEMIAPGRSALGLRIRQGIDAIDSAEGPPPVWYTVVGVVENNLWNDPSLEQAIGAVYFPFEQDVDAGRTWFLTLRPVAPGLPILDAVREEVLHLDAELPLFETMTMEQRLADAFQQRRAPAYLIGLFAAVALLLATLGVYGVLAYNVSQRTREIGIRMALGARYQDLLRMIQWQGLRLILLGLGAGLLGAALASRIIATVLFGVHPLEPLVYAAVCLILGTVGFFASLLPAWRAARLDPLTALRQE